MKKLFVFSCLMAVLHFPTSCGCDSAACECEDFSNTYRFSIIKALQTATGTYDGYRFTTHSSQDTLSYQSGAIQVEIAETEHIAQAETLHFSMMPKAFACSPLEPEAQQIERIRISSNKTTSFDEQEYQSGEDLSAVFYVANKECSSASCSSIADFLVLQNDRPYLFGYQGDNLIFMLKSKPDEIIKQQFKFEFVFSDSTTVATETTEIIIR